MVSRELSAAQYAAVKHAAASRRDLERVSRERMFAWEAAVAAAFRAGVRSAELARGVSEINGDTGSISEQRAYQLHAQMAADGRLNP